MSTADVYGNLLAQALQGNVQVNTHPLKMALLSGYTPNPTTLGSDTHWSDISSHEISGPGYTAGGATLTGVSLTVTDPISWSHQWSAAQAYTYGQVVRPPAANGYLYRCVQAGTSGGSTPAFPTTVGLTVGDNGIIWANAGSEIIVLNSAAVTWPNADFSATSSVLYDSTTGVLIATDGFGTTEAPVAQTFTLTPDPILGWAYWIVT